MRIVETINLTLNELEVCCLSTFTIVEDDIFVCFIKTGIFVVATGCLFCNFYTGPCCIVSISIPAVSINFFPTCFCIVKVNNRFCWECSKINCQTRTSTDNIYSLLVNYFNRVTALTWTCNYIWKISFSHNNTVRNTDYLEIISMAGRVRRDNYVCFTCKIKVSKTRCWKWVPF